MRAEFTSLKARQQRPASAAVQDITTAQPATRAAPPEPQEPSTAHQQVSAQGALKGQQHRDGKEFIKHSEGGHHSTPLGTQQEVTPLGGKSVAEGAKAQSAARPAGSNGATGQQPALQQPSPEEATVSGKRERPLLMLPAPSAVSYAAGLPHLAADTPDELEVRVSP